MRIRRTTGFIVLSLFIAFVFAACGGGGGSSAPAPVPEVVTASASSISTDNALLNGTVNPNGLATTYWFEWGTSSTLATYDNTTSKLAGSGTAIVAVSNPISGLSQATTYYFRLAASNSAGTTKGLIISLTTASPLDPPTVQTLAADNLSVTGATLHANVTPNGLATTAYFEWGTDNTFAVPNVIPVPAQSVGADTTSHLFNAILPDLTTGTKYYYRVVANNSAGTSRGLAASFTTNTLAPAVATVAASPVGNDNALLRGTVNPNGLATTYHFEWGTSSTLETFDNTPTLSAGSGTGDVAESAQISGLSDNTTYYFRIVATSTAGGTSQSTIRPFTTVLKAAPIAIAHSNETVYTFGPGTDNSSPGRTVVTLDGSESTGSYGALASYGWTQTAGTNTATPADPSADITTVTVPILDPSVSVPDNIVFLLTVTDSKGQSGTDTISKYVKWGYFDDFSINSTAAYERFDTWNTGGTFTWESGRAKVVAGATTGIKFQKTFTGDSKLIYNTGVFSFDFTPTAEAGSGGSISVRLGDGTAYLELSTADGKVRKVWPSAAVDEAAFVFPYTSDSTTYHITISYSQERTTFTATGGGLTVGPVSLTTNTNSLSPYVIEIDSVQQTSYFDNIKLEAAP